MMRRVDREVLVDLCVQREYLDPAARNRCINAQQIASNVKHLVALARLYKLPVLSCVDVAYPPPNGKKSGMRIPFHGVPDARKPAYALVHDTAVIESDNWPCVSLDVFERHQQVILTKCHSDPFTNPKLDRLLTEMAASRFVVFGLPVETSVRMAVLGLIRRGREVSLVHDACGWFHDAEAAMALRQLHVKGCQLLSTEAYVRDVESRLRPRPRSRRLMGGRSVA